MVERRLDVYCLSNMGLHVLIDGHSILIDALTNGEQRPYAGIPLDMAQTIIRGGPPYERVDMMLISHHHEDHFDAGLVARFVLERPHVPVYSSPQVVDAVARLAPEMDSPVSIKPKLMHTVSFSKGRLGVTAVALRHAGPQYADILNLAFIVEGSHSIIFAGDAAFSEENMERLAELCPCPALLVIPFHWFSVKTECQRMRHILRPSRVLITHLPCEEGDRWGWNRAVRNALALEAFSPICCAGIPGTRCFWPEV